MEMNYSGLKISFYEMGLNDAGSDTIPFYEQVYASLFHEMRIIKGFMERFEGEGKAIQDVASLNCTTEMDVKEVIKSAQSIIDRFALVDNVESSSRSSRGCREDSTTDQTLRSMRSTYITQVEEVLNFVAPAVERWSVDAGGYCESFSSIVKDSSIDWSDTKSIIDIWKRLDQLSLVDFSASAQIQRASEAESPIIQSQGVPKRFTYPELLIATANFSEKLGDGGFGSVYRGALQPWIPVAVKRMNAVDSTHHQGMKEFEREVSVISQLRHQNLIELQGWCEDPARGEYMLVYEFMSNGSLDKLLFDQVKRTSLSWSQRFNILTGIADALAYLHKGTKAQQVIHGDIKCANILLDNNLNAKLTDFGLSRLIDHQGKAYTKKLSGTKGYIAPELCSEGKFTEKSDVFAFGVVVLEVVCGQRNWLGNWPCHEDKQRDKRTTSLVDWVGERLCEGDLLSAVHSELRGCESYQMASQMETTLAIGLACCDFDHRKRPAMRVVVEMLAGGRQDELKKMWMVKEEENGERDVCERLTPTLDLMFDELWNTSITGCLYYEASPGSLVAEDIEASPAFGLEWTSSAEME